jgi:Sec-independent protein translocase protein TatA
MFNFIKNIGPTELIVVAVVILFFFGAKIATKLGKAGGETYKEIKKVKKSFTDAVGDEGSEKVS